MITAHQSSHTSQSTRRKPVLHILVTAPPEVHALIKMALKDIPNLNLICAMDGIDALRQVKLESVTSNRIRLVFANAAMPKMSGIELARELKKEAKGAPYVVIMNSLHADAVHMAMEAGADKVIPMPVEFVQQLRAIVFEHKARLETEENGKL